MRGLNFDVIEMRRAIDRLQGFAEAGRLPEPVWDAARSGESSDRELLVWLERDTWRLQALYAARSLVQETAICEYAAGEIYRQRVGGLPADGYGLGNAREVFLDVLKRGRHLCESQGHTDSVVPQTSSQTLTSNRVTGGTSRRDVRIAELTASLDGPARERVQRIASLFNPVLKNGDK